MSYLFPNILKKKKVLFLIFLCGRASCPFILKQLGFLWFKNKNHCTDFGMSWPTVCVSCILPEDTKMEESCNIKVGIYLKNIGPLKKMDCE